MENLSLKTPEPTVKVAEPGSYSYGVHIGYAVQFHRNVGLGLGVDLARYGTGTRITGDRYWMGVTDTEGEVYNHRMHIYSLRDQMQQIYLNIPLSLRLIVPLRGVSLEGQIGGKLGVPLWTSFAYQGDVEHFGQYPQWGEMELSQVPNHGFYRTNKIAGANILPNQLTVFVFGKLGVVVPLTKILELTAHVGVDYGVWSTEMGNRAPETGNGELGCNNDKDPAHKFMPAYSGIMNTNICDGKMHPLAVNGEIGLRLKFAHKRKYACKCARW